MSGPYCSQCGQREQVGAKPMHDLLHEAWHLFTHIDGRLLATLSILLRRPGQLAVDYFAGRRARYVAPFQLYLIISVVLFSLVSLGLHMHPQEPLRAAPVVKQQPQSNSSLSVRMDFGECNTWDLRFTWLTEVMRDACDRQARDNGKALERNWIGSLSKMMFIFLPLMALIVMLLYWRPRRFYVEHLLFLLQLHATLYLTIIINMALEIPGRYVPWLGRAAEIVVYLSWLYVLWYLFAAMRRFYGQSRLRTASKMLALIAAYVVCLALMMIGSYIFNAIVT